jgi:phi13 family phage major tail protein
MEVASTLGEIGLELNVANLTNATLAALLGHEVVSGKLVKKASDVAPWLALGFRSLKSNGNYKYVWLVKGKFAPSTEDHTTKGDTVEFQTPTINGSFVKRDFDDIYQMQGDEDDAEFTEDMAAQWFTTATLDAAAY